MFPPQSSIYSCETNSLDAPCVSRYSAKTDALVAVLILKQCGEVGLMLGTNPVIEKRRPIGYQ